jgi:hypothetical protein
MQSALATTRPIKNRLFSLSLDLQALIYGYVEWEDGHLIDMDKIFKIFHQDIMNGNMLYHWYWMYRYKDAIRIIPTIKNSPTYFCRVCEYPMFRKMCESNGRQNKISDISYAPHRYFPSECSKMCDHLSNIRYLLHRAGHHYYDDLKPYGPDYNEDYDRIYKEYFANPENQIV